MKAAFSVWNNRIAPVFDVARHIRMIEVDSGQVTKETDDTLDSDAPGEKALHLATLGIETLVCGAISRPLEALVGAYGIRVIPFVSGELPDVVKAWISGRLGTRLFAMPGCCGRGRWVAGRAVFAKGGFMRDRNGMGGGGGGGGGGRGKGRGLGGGMGGMGRRQGQAGSGRGRMGGPLAAGPGGVCACPKCGHEVAHRPGVPCIQEVCPKCGANMTRK